MTGTILSDFGLVFDRPIAKSEKTIEERSRCIFSNISSFVEKKVRTGGIWKLSLNVNSSNERQHKKPVGGVLKYNVKFDVDEFLSLPISEQKEAMLDFILLNLQAAFDECGMDSTLLEGVREYTIQRNFVSQFSGPITNFRSFSSRVVCEQGYMSTDVCAVISDGERELAKLPVTTVSPDEFCFQAYLVPAIWKSPSELEITAATGEKFALIWDAQHSAS